MLVSVKFFSPDKDFKNRRLAAIKGETFTYPLCKISRLIFNRISYTISEIFSCLGPVIGVSLGFIDYGGS